MIKAGYRGSGINEVIWMGDVVNEASNLANYGNKESYDKETMVSSVFQSNLTEHQKGLLEYSKIRGCYQGYIINGTMNDWYKQNCP